MAKAIMIQGTMSNAGKSLLAAGLCRIFKQDGYSVAPFKAQNMALNSFITKEGLEMGRAQVTQAEAAGIQPSVLMNPVLLKPTNDTRSQVIINGEVAANMSAQEYYKHKREIVPEIQKAYDALASRHDIIVIEGAGSPAEINLQENDIVNMFMARLAKAPVLLAGDIDRGGVFASLVGTMMLFPEEDRKMVKATIINKFRGDRTILQPGLDMLEEKIGVPTAGVVPYLHVDIDDEDSLTERFSRKKEAALVDIAVLRLPRISNFTDFNVLEYAAGVSLRYVDSVGDLGNPDLIILPGTKNTMEDLLFLRQCGLEAAVLKHAAAGKPVFGICGGFQMLGEELSDPHGVEHGGILKGMGLLPARTVFEPQKTRTQARGRFLEGVSGIFSQLSGVDFYGYEIHMGQTEPIAAACPESAGWGAGIATGGSEAGFCPEMAAGGLPEGKRRGRQERQELREEAGPLTQILELSGKPVDHVAGMCKGSVYGSYIHGIFDREEVAKTLLSALFRSKGLPEDAAAGLDVAAYKEEQYNILAAAMRESLDMDMIYRILKEGV